jgi:hypothetical protein
VPKFRSPVLGFNHNIRHKGWMFHVQTEDSGITSPHIFTHLFHEGVIIASKKLEYDAEADGDIVKALMQAQHKSVMKELKHGSFDEKILKYLGEAPPEPSGEHAAVPTDISGDDAGTTVPTTPAPELVLDEASAASSLPYIAMDVVTDQGSASSAGTLAARRADSAPPAITPLVDEQADLESDDDDINGLLNRLRADTPLPELIEEPAGGAKPPPIPVEESRGAWLVSRPGQKERPFDKTGGVPVEVGDEVARRILTPPSVDVSAVSASASAYSQHTRKGTLSTHPVASPVTPPVGVPTGSGANRRGSQPPASGTRVAAPSPSVKPSAQPPVARPIPAAPTRAYAPIASRPPVPPPPPAPRQNLPPPVLPRPASTSSSQPAVTARAGAPGSPPPSRSQPLPPVVPRPPVPPPPKASPATTAPLRSQAIAVPPRRSQESVVVARPAVVIGAPPTVVGGNEARRPHGREPTPPPVQPESIFGQDLISEKSLDEVIMAYLSEDSNDD